MILEACNQETAELDKTCDVHVNVTIKGIVLDFTNGIQPLRGVRFHDLRKSVSH